MTEDDILGQFAQWYEGPEGTDRWIKECESVKGFLARAFVAGYALRDAEKADVPPPLPPARAPYAPGRQEPEKAYAFRQAYGSRPAGLTPPDGDFIQQGTITGRIPTGPPPPQPLPLTRPDIVEAPGYVYQEMPGRPVLFPHGPLEPRAGSGQLSGVNPLPPPAPASDYGWWRPDDAAEADPGHEDPADG